MRASCHTCDWQFMRPNAGARHARLMQSNFIQCRHQQQQQRQQHPTAIDVTTTKRNTFDVAPCQNVLRVCVCVCVCARFMVTLVSIGQRRHILAENSDQHCVAHSWMPNVIAPTSAGCCCCRAQLRCRCDAITWSYFHDLRAHSSAVVVLARALFDARECMTRCLTMCRLMDGRAWNSMNARTHYAYKHTHRHSINHRVCAAMRSHVAIACLNRFKLCVYTENETHECSIIQWYYWIIFVRNVPRVWFCLDFPSFCLCNKSW